MRHDDADRHPLDSVGQPDADTPAETTDWSELDDDPSDLGSRLRSLLDPAEDLPNRTRQDVDRTLRGRSVLSTGLELLGLGVWTASTLLSDPPGDADGNREGDLRWK